MQDAREKIAKALDIRDEVAQHDHVLGAAHALTDEAFDGAVAAHKPQHDPLDRALDTKEKLAKFGVNVAEEEAMWKQELEEGMRELDNITMLS